MGLRSLMTNEYNTGWLKKWLTGEPHLTLYQDGQRYLERRYVIPRNSHLNVYLHKFLKSDEDEALHDHPWNWCSIILRGGYTEHRSDGSSRRRAGSIVVRKPEVAHRVQLDWGNAWCRELPVWTLFITGPKQREWGFHCPRGWIPWTKFTTGPKGSIRVGCGEYA
jgi:hypothetical protein